MRTGLPLGAPSQSSRFCCPIASLRLEQTNLGMRTVPLLVVHVKGVLLHIVFYY
jgi:hypothetical protein